jgi:hypothetical protein
MDDLTQKNSRSLLFFLFLFMPKLIGAVFY